MTRLVCALALVASISAGCVTYERGHYAALSTTSPRVAMTTVAEAVEGRACGSLFEAPMLRAIDAALASASGANALIGVTYRVENLCMVIRGTAVQIH